MGIVLNEYDWVEQAIRDRSLGKEPLKTLSRVSKYYYAMGYSKVEIRKMLDTFLVQCDPTTSLVKWSSSLDKLAKSADKYPMIRLDGVAVTKAELERIAALDSVMARKLAFTLLCVAKYWNAAMEHNDSWVNTEDREIMKMANVSTSVKRQSLLYGQLRDAGLLRFSKRIDNLNVQVLFLEEGETALYVRDFRNLGYQYLWYYGGPYFACACCGITGRLQSPSAGRTQKYCKECAENIRAQQNIASVMRHRAVEKSAVVGKNDDAKKTVPQ
jgi:hypothetical protein